MILFDRSSKFISIFFYFVLKISDGKFSVESSVRFMSQMAQGNNELLKIIEEISNDCVAVTDDDR